MARRAFKILIIMQNKFRSLLIERELASNFETSIITLAATSYDALNHINNKFHDIIIIDHNLSSDFDCDFIKKVTKNESESSFIVLTEDCSEQNVRFLKKIGIDRLLKNDDSAYVAIPRLVKEIIGQKLITKKKENISRSEDNVYSDIINIAVGTLSHEINNPLMTILGTAELILEDSLRIDNELINKIKVIHKSALRVQKSLYKLKKVSNPKVRETYSGKLIDIDRSQIIVNK